LMTRVDIDAKGGRAKKKPKAWSKSPPGKDEAQDKWGALLGDIVINVRNPK